MPYQEDLDAALQQLRCEVFEAGDHYWANGGDWRPEEEPEPRPRSWASSTSWDPTTPWTTTPSSP
ncbi:hypothetical protein ABZ372_22685 [Streptomyces sp. NPDC005921]